MLMSTFEVAITEEMDRREHKLYIRMVVVVPVERRRKEWVLASARSARFVIELNQVLYLDPILNYNSAKVASPTIHIDQKRREVVQDHPIYPIQLFSRRCDRYSPQTSSST
jgi:hypothetical protein